MHASRLSGIIFCGDLILQWTHTRASSKSMCLADSDVSGIVTDKKSDSMAKCEARLNSSQAYHERTPRRWKITEPLLPSLCSPVQFFIGHNLLYWKIK